MFLSAEQVDEAFPIVLVFLGGWLATIGSAVLWKSWSSKQGLQNKTAPAPGPLVAAQVE